MKKYNIRNIFGFNCFEINSENHIIIGQKGIINYHNLYDNKNLEVKPINQNIAYFGGLRINKNFLVITSNSVYPGGKDILSFCNTKKKRISKSIEGYSFVFSPNGLSIMPREDKNNNRIILAACKKYQKNQKNGILLVNSSLEDKKDIENPFYETDNFEVHCFCPILIVKNSNKSYNNINEEYKKGIQITDTDYFLVGGFDEDRMEGAIRLYKIIYNENNYKTTIKYIQDIELDNKKMGELDGPINCIIQSKISGNIIISCYNGKIYLFSAPNLDYYLNDK
jgi:hypothetical protein